MAADVLLQQRQQMGIDAVSPGCGQHRRRLLLGRRHLRQLGNNSTTQSNVAVAVTTSGVLSGTTLIQSP
jgi:hypothetical protein